MSLIPFAPFLYGRVETEYPLVQSMACIRPTGVSWQHFPRLLVPTGGKLFTA